MKKVKKIFSVKVWAAAAVISAVILAGCGTSGQEAPAAGATAGSLKEEDQSLTEFCGDEELNAWFDGIEENTPAEMTYTIYGEAPIGMDFTDRDLIIETVKALRTVRIGGESKEDPDHCEDAGGLGYYFEMEDGTKKSFSFVLGCFKWKDSSYHDVTDYGDLQGVNEKLEKIGNPQYTYIYAEDDGFYTQYLETYTTKWEEEDGCGGGLYIYPGEVGEPPYVEICRCDGDADDPEGFLEGELMQYLNGKAEETGGVLTQTSPAEIYKVGSKTLTGAVFTVQMPEEKGGGNMEYFNQILQESDDLLDEKCLIRFCAAYDGTDEEEKASARKELNKAVSEFYFKHTAYQEKEVQPDNYLVEFINDDRMREWFDKAEDNPPDILSFSGKKNTSSDDSELISRVLAALRTVKIGGATDEHMEGSKRSIYDFHYIESGESVTFYFYGDIFYWDNRKYSVTDWGDLKNIKIR